MPSAELSDERMPHSSRLQNVNSWKLIVDRDGWERSGAMCEVEAPVAVHRGQTVSAKAEMWVFRQEDAPHHDVREESRSSGILRANQRRDVRVKRDVSSPVRVIGDEESGKTRTNLTSSSLSFLAGLSVSQPTSRFCVSASCWTAPSTTMAKGIFSGFKGMDAFGKVIRLRSGLCKFSGYLTRLARPWRTSRSRPEQAHCVRFRPFLKVVKLSNAKWVSQ
jgi:hypothetical protein